LGKNRKKRKNKHSKFKVFLIVFILTLIVTSGIGTGIKVYENGGGLQGVVATVLGTKAAKDAETINILLLGISEDLNSKLTDTIMVCSYNPKTQKASILSIPRDTFIGTNINVAKANDKINTVYSRSGINKCISKIESITGQTIPYYAVVNTDALIKIVDIIGGVNFEVPIDMDYDDPTQDLHIHLKSGMQKITGEKAEQLLRFRHNTNGTSYPESYGDNDYGRMRTQREFIKETIKQTLQFKNITKAKKIADAIFENIETNLSSEIIKEYISYAVEFDSSNILMNQLPGESVKYNDVWVYDYSISKTKTTMEEIESYLNQTENDIAD
jgi:LCP family protein required for cell wall assembly